MALIRGRRFYFFKFGTAQASGLNGQKAKFEKNFFRRSFGQLKKKIKSKATYFTTCESTDIMA